MDAARQKSLIRVGTVPPTITWCATLVWLHTGYPTMSAWIDMVFGIAATSTIIGLLLDIRSGPVRALLRACFLLIVAVTGILVVRDFPRSILPDETPWRIVITALLVSAPGIGLLVAGGLRPDFLWRRMKPKHEPE